MSIEEQVQCILRVCETQKMSYAERLAMIDRERKRIDKAIRGGHRQANIEYWEERLAVLRAALLMH